MTTRFIIASLAAAAVAAPAVAATADTLDTTQPLSTVPIRTLDQGASVGTFGASGKGVVVVRGRLTVYGNLLGVLTVRDPAGDAIVKLKGVVQRPRLIRGVRVYTFPRGNRTFYVKGRNVRVIMSSGKRGRVAVSAFGRGAVLRLSGTGTYSINNDPTKHSWAGASLPIPIRAG